MQPYQKDFIEFAIANRVLCFGDYVLKSGRNSPYFFNAGLFNDGASLSRLGQFYASAIMASGIGFDMLFGPAYKGIPLASSVAIALAGSCGTHSCSSGWFMVDPAWRVRRTAIRQAVREHHCH